ncbi:glycoside hydrolase [Pseudomonas sp. HR96]|uniref:glycoside hydrolase n=1 Tax=Pseudomonas sp. HR96 TaxID=1027966 RepID=UPI002A75982C|nr:glycoside hydrolase [Pseudomonas sp. HR96]WPP00118.1 glycoside hydrolase [Pseudomonas sp. HR96]
MRLFAVSLLVLCLLSPWAGAAVLQNGHWRVDVHPATLAISVTPAGEAPVQASAGVAAHRVSVLLAEPARLSWQWDDGAFHLEARLQERELLLSVRAREAGELALLKQPGSAMGKGLLWPLAEGHYVPRGDSIWRDYLLAEGELNTTQDLSLPLWGSDHGRFSLHWLLTTPWNNRLRLAADGDALAIELSHTYTRIQPDAPMTWRLYLGDANPLAGAQRYREWLLEQGQYQTLEDKWTAAPEGRKLLGATHAYLWGTGLLGSADVRDWQQLLTILRSERALPRRLRGRLDGYSLELLQGSAAAPHERQALLRGLNAALNSVARDSWQGAHEPDMRVLAHAYSALRKEVAGEFAAALSPLTEQWGDGLSLRTLERLGASGLQGLSLVLGDSWEGGLWHPHVVRAAVAAGYLIGPYDSYETALAPGDNPDWTSAHFGQAVHERCALINEDGQSRPGFMQNGHYTDPHCMQPLLHKRVTAIQAQAGFNAWFLDAAAAGMVYDSYRPGALLTQAQNAEGHQQLADWLSAQGLALGSEDGNAVTSRSIQYAHGMQTPVLGWGDQDLMKNRSSPFFLGAWYPPEEPAIFFRQVALKEPYRTLHFAPQTRLPLYQAVYHGSIITSHHWNFDNLKLSNVRAENELTQLLYNVAPLYHLNSATLSRRLPIMARHAQFFRPLHQALATQPLLAFDWLSEDRLVQQTTFADGSRLLANFAREPRSIQGHALAGQSLLALLADGSIRTYRAEAASGTAPDAG